MKLLFFGCLLILFSISSRAEQITMQACTDVTVTTTSTIFASLNQARKYLIIQNKSPGNVLLKFNAVHVANEGLQIVEGGNYEPKATPINAIALKTLAGSNTVTICEGK